MASAPRPTTRRTISDDSTGASVLSSAFDDEESDELIRVQAPNPPSKVVATAAPKVAKQQSNGKPSNGHDYTHSDSDDENLEDSEEQDIWETQSFYDDICENLPNDTVFGPEEDACTPEQSQWYRSRLKDVGMAQFIQETIMSRKITARKLITAFGIRPPDYFDDKPDDQVQPLLYAAITKELSKRRKLQNINTLEDVARLLKTSKNIVVLTGAGISTSLGIPDFRSKENGLYSRLTGLGLSDPQEVFDIRVFQDDPSVFYSVAKDILPETDKVSPTHAFIKLLQTKGKLLTQYTQNIDNLEIRAGILPEKLIQCHGSFATASCMKDKTHKVKGEDIFPEMREGKVARCDKCIKILTDAAKAKARAGKKRKRTGKDGRPAGGSGRKNPAHYGDSSADEEEINIFDAGVMKPDITFFGESLPAAFNDRLVDHDRKKVDLLICIGTSLKVEPVSEIIPFLPPEVPQINISKTPVTHFEFDIEFLGSCDDVVVELSKLAGWDLQHEMIPPNIKLKTELMEGTKSQYKVERV